MRAVWEMKWLNNVHILYDRKNNYLCDVAPFINLKEAYFFVDSNGQVRIFEKMETAKKMAEKMFGCEEPLE